MSELSLAISIFGVMIWLLLSGWAFGKIIKGQNVQQDGMGILFLFCLFLGPMMAAIALVIGDNDED